MSPAPRFSASPWRWSTQWLVRPGYGGFYAYSAADPDYARGPYDTIGDALDAIADRPRMPYKTAVAVYLAGAKIANRTMLTRSIERIAHAMRARGLKQ